MSSRANFNDYSDYDSNPLFARGQTEANRTGPSIGGLLGANSMNLPTPTRTASHTTVADGTMLTVVSE